MGKNCKRIPDTELEVMQALWACEVPAARTDIEKILFETHPMALTSLLTMLTRLGEKGYLVIEKKERKSYYTPAVTREEYLAAQGRDFYEKLCGGSMSLLASALCDSGLTKEELTELRKLLERDAL